MNSRLNWIFCYAALGLTMMLAGCATTSAPSSPYWESPQWRQDLFTSIRSNLHFPDKLIDEGMLHGEGTVSFDYKDGKLVNVKIDKSTGDKLLDEVIVFGVSRTKPPRVDSADSKAPHAFILTLDMDPSIEQFRMMIYLSITKDAKLISNVYPVTPALVELDADYLNGILTNAKWSDKTGNKRLDDALKNWMSTIKFPQPLSYMVDKPMPIKVRICVSQKIKPCMKSDLGAWRAINGLSFVMTP